MKLSDEHMDILQRQGARVQALKRSGSTTDRKSIHEIQFVIESIVPKDMCSDSFFLRLAARYCTDPTDRNWRIMSAAAFYHQRKGRE